MKSKPMKTEGIKAKIQNFIVINSQGKNQLKAVKIQDRSNMIDTQIS